MACCQGCSADAVATWASRASDLHPEDAPSASEYSRGCRDCGLYWTGRRRGEAGQQMGKGSIDLAALCQPDAVVGSGDHGRRRQQNRAVDAIRAVRRERLLGDASRSWIDRPDPDIPRGPIETAHVRIEDGIRIDFDVSAGVPEAPVRASRSRDGLPRPASNLAAWAALNELAVDVGPNAAVRRLGDRQVGLHGGEPAAGTHPQIGREQAAARRWGDRELERDVVRAVRRAVLRQWS